MRYAPLSACVLAVITAMPVFADEFAGTASFSRGSVYGSLAAGYAVSSDVDVFGAETFDGVTVTASGAFSFKGGPYVSAALGYWLTPYLAVEAEVGYAHLAYDELSGTITATDGVNTLSIAGATDIDGTIGLFTGLANVIVSPLQAEAFRPYAGLGVGFGHIDETVDAIGGDLAFAVSSSATELAASALAGFDYGVSDRFAVGARYQLYWLNSGTDYTDDSLTHAFSLRGSFKF